jgi:hypothetical protein
VVVEVGPRLSFTTAWSANAVSICKACALPEIARIERSRRYLLSLAPEVAPLDQTQLDSFAGLVHDRMTECVYPDKLMSFKTHVVPEPVIQIPVLEQGRAALEVINKTMGLAFDEFDLEVKLPSFSYEFSFHLERLALWFNGGFLLFREHALGLHLHPMTIVLNSAWHPVTLVFAPSEVKWLAHVYLLVNVPVLYKALP